MNIISCMMRSGTGTSIQMVTGGGRGWRTECLSARRKHLALLQTSVGDPGRGAQNGGQVQDMGRIPR